MCPGRPPFDWPTISCLAPSSAPGATPRGRVPSRSSPFLPASPAWRPSRRPRLEVEAQHDHLSVPHRQGEKCRLKGRARGQDVGRCVAVRPCRRFARCSAPRRRRCDRARFSATRWAHPPGDSSVATLDQWSHTRTRVSCAMSPATCGSPHIRPSDATSRGYSRRQKASDSTVADAVFPRRDVGAPDDWKRRS